MSDQRFWSPAIRGLAAYTPGEQPREAGWVKLNTNECPYPPSPRALRRIAEAADERLRLYPDPRGTELRAEIAARMGLRPGQVFVGNGSDEVLAHAFMALLRHGRPVLVPDISYSFYPVYCALYGIECQPIALDEAFRIRVDDYLRSNGGIVLPNPNAPTGVALPLQDIRRLLERNTGSVLVVDEAYVDFGAESAAALVDEFPNLLVVQTLSKSRALAGLRVGFALGHADLIQALETVKDSFNSYPLDRLAQAGALGALQDPAYFEAITERIVRSRDWLAGQLRALGFEGPPSSANFLLVTHPRWPAPRLQQALRERRILVRHFKQARIANHLRISIGSQAECEVLVRALQGILGASASSPS